MPTPGDRSLLQGNLPVRQQPHKKARFMGLTIRSSRDRFAARRMRYRVAHCQAATRPGLTQVLGVSMENALHLIAQVLFSQFGAVLALTIGVLCAAAIWLSPTRSVRRFLILTCALWLAFAMWSYWESPNTRQVVAGFLWGLAVLGLSTLALAPLVAYAKTRRTILVVSLLLFVVQIPFGVLTGLFFGCYVGHDCP